MDEHWPQPGASCPRGQRGKSAFGNGCIEHALRAKTFDQARRCSEDSCLAIGADPVDENTRIKLHRLPLGGIDRLSEIQARAARTRLLGNGALSHQHCSEWPGSCLGLSAPEAWRHAVGKACDDTRVFARPIAGNDLANVGEACALG